MRTWSPCRGAGGTHLQAVANMANGGGASAASARGNELRTCRQYSRHGYDEDMVATPGAGGTSAGGQEGVYYYTGNGGGMPACTMCGSEGERESWVTINWLVD